MVDSADSAVCLYGESILLRAFALDRAVRFRSIVESDFSLLHILNYFPVCPDPGELEPPPSLFFSG